ncbi:MAG: helix-turn-helix domain-containing protein [Bacilli bacterium]|nr:helix-turn-helix domain-containing protein [Bacilli bacterium]
MQDLSHIVGTNLSNLRKEKGLTQLELANVLHYSDKSISKWELGYAIPSVDILKEFADYYGVTIDFLITEQQPESIQEVVTQAEAQKDPQVVNKAIVLSLLNVAIVLIATLAFVAALFRGSEGPIWLAFIWAVPTCCLISLISARFLYGRNTVVTAVLLSSFVWTLVLAVSFHYQFTANEPIWYIVTACIPIQAIIILAIFIRRHAVRK